MLFLKHEEQKEDRAQVPGKSKFMNKQAIYLRVKEKGEEEKEEGGAKEEVERERRGEGKRGGERGGERRRR